MKSIHLAVLLSALALLGCQHSRGSSFLAPGVDNFDFAPSSFRLEGDHLVGDAAETSGIDLNGDGDSSDVVLETIDLGNGRKSVLPYAALEGFQVSAGLVAFTVNECAQEADLDGDGDVDCSNVLFVHDLATGGTTNVGLPVAHSFDTLHVRRTSLAQDGVLLAFTVREVDRGADLDGDGELTHELAYTYEADLARITPTGLRNHLVPLIDHGRMFLAVPEDGLEDLNGDGDTLDSVLFVHDIRTGVNQNLGWAVQASLTGSAAGTPRVRVDGPLVAVLVPEFEQGGQDLTGDGDALDFVVEIIDLESGTTFQVNHSVQDFWVDGDLVGLAVLEQSSEEPEANDLNADGDTNDLVALFYDRLTGALTNTAVALDHILVPTLAPRMSDRRAAFLVAEEMQGVDLNGDGDTQDYVLHLFDARTGGVNSSGLAVWNEVGAFASDSEHVVCALLGQHGPPELGDPIGTAVGWDGSALQSLALNAHRLRIAAGSVLVSVLESAQGVDLNGDGDQDDLVLEVVDLGTGRVLNTRIAVSTNDAFETPLEFDGRHLAVPVDEAREGRDLNGDGDRDDHFLSVVRLP